MELALFFVFAAAFGGISLYVRELLQRREAARAQELREIIEGDADPVDVVCTLARRRSDSAADARRWDVGEGGGSSHDVTVARHRIPGSLLTVEIHDAATCPAPHRVPHPHHDTVLGVWGTQEELEAVTRAQDAVRRFLEGEGSNSIREGRVAAEVFGNADAMGEAALMGDVGDVVRSLRGTA